LSYWEKFWRLPSAARACIAGLHIGDEHVETAMRRPERVVWEFRTWTNVATVAVVIVGVIAVAGRVFRMGAGELAEQVG
jgi:hypothetical protein